MKMVILPTEKVLSITEVSLFVLDVGTRMRFGLHSSPARGVENDAYIAVNA
jgi:hypothetical protein